MTVGARAGVLCCVSIVLLAPAAAFAQDACGNVAAFAKSLPGTSIESSKSMPAKDRLPAFCEVHATISPVPGSHIGAASDAVIASEAASLRAASAGAPPSVVIGAGAPRHGGDMAMAWPLRRVRARQPPAASTA